MYIIQIVTIQPLSGLVSHLSSLLSAIKHLRKVVYNVSVAPYDIQILIVSPLFFFFLM
jgi:hypothetical protein